jgi:cytoskeletal protein CcmA (bactofilin family)
MFRDKGARPSAHRDDVNGILGEGTHMEGSLRFPGRFHIEGRFKGDVDSDDTLVIGEKADAEGEFRVGELVVMGVLRGNVAAQRSVEIHSTGKVYGSVRTPSLKIDEGAVFEGDCHMEQREASGAGAKVTPISRAAAAAPAENG